MFIYMTNNEILRISAARTVMAGNSLVDHGRTNLSTSDYTPTTLKVDSDTGTSAILPSATPSLAGLASSADKTKLNGIEAGATLNSTDATLLSRANHTGTQLANTVSDFTSTARTATIDDSIGSGITNKAPSQDAVFNALFTKVDKVGGKGLSTEDFSTAEKSKLAGVAANATANSADAALLNRTNHTGTQPSSTISDFNSAVDARIRKVETFLGTTDSSGNYTVIFDTAYATAPDIHPEIIGATFNQFVRVASVSTTGFTVQAAQRNTATLLATEVLLGTTVNLVGASVSVQVTARAL